MAHDVLTFSVVRSIRSALFAAVCLGSAACGSSSERAADPSSAPSAPDESAEWAIVGGTPSAQRSVVLVADTSDRYACTGVLVQSDVVLVRTGCTKDVAAVYVDFSAPVDSADPIGPAAAGATRIEIVGRAPLELAPGLSENAGLLRLASSAPIAANVAASMPALGSTCAVVGLGPTVGSPGGFVSGYPTVGVQRTANMTITASADSEVRAKGLNGSVLLGDFDAFLFCGGDLVGPKISSRVGRTAADHESIFAALPSSTNTCIVNGGLAVIGVLPAAPTCTVIECSAGAIESTSAGCAAGVRTRTCDANGRWGRFSLTCS